MQSHLCPVCTDACTNQTINNTSAGPLLVVCLCAQVRLSKSTCSVCPCVSFWSLLAPIPAADDIPHPAGDHRHLRRPGALRREVQPHAPCGVPRKLRRGPVAGAAPPVRPPVQRGPPWVVHRHQRVLPRLLLLRYTFPFVCFVEVVVNPVRAWNVVCPPAPSFFVWAITNPPAPLTLRRISKDAERWLLIFHPRPPRM